MQLTKLSRVAISVTGIVQGVGFRPFVHGLASRHQLTGFVRNNDGVVEIEVQGEKAALEEFIRDLVDTAPPLAEINAVQSFTIEARLEQSFAIEQSSSTAKGSKLVPPDAATCAQCLEELFCAENRRFRYPFINCTNCGPRFTIMRSLPYDRAATTMDCFAMCQACRAEYTDPRDRRFHAEPNACARCGPRIFWLDATPSDGHENHCRHEKNDRQLSRLSAIADGAALERTVAALAEGKIVAIKGLGGFHLVCDAGNASAIAALRKRKHRQAKPLALMMADPAMVRNFCNL